MNPNAVPYVQTSVARISLWGSMFIIPVQLKVWCRDRFNSNSVQPPPLDVVKFSGDPCEYFRFKVRFHETVDSQNISEAQKMVRLLQFLDGQAKECLVVYQRPSKCWSSVLDNHML